MQLHNAVSLSLPPSLPPSLSLQCTLPSAACPYSSPPRPTTIPTVRPHRASFVGVMFFINIPPSQSVDTVCRAGPRSISDATWAPSSLRGTLSACPAVAARTADLGSPRPLRGVSDPSPEDPSDDRRGAGSRPGVMMASDATLVDNLVRRLWSERLVSRTNPRSRGTRSESGTPHRGSANRID